MGESNNSIPPGKLCKLGWDWKTDLKDLEGYSVQVPAYIFVCPPSIPLLALRTQAGMMDMENRIAVEKVCLVARIMNSSKNKENLYRKVL